MHVAITIWAVIASSRVWNWERFYKYQATILYMSAMNLLYLFFTMGYHLWRLQPDLGMPISIVNMLYTFIVFPCTVVLFLSQYPKSFKNKVFHVLKWIIIYISVEWIGSLMNRITYEHGWHLGWSLLFLIMMFPMIRLHHKKPVLAYLLTFIFIALILCYFKVPWKISVEDHL